MKLRRSAGDVESQNKISDDNAKNGYHALLHVTNIYDVIASHVFRNSWKHFDIYSWTVILIRAHACVYVGLHAHSNDACMHLPLNLMNINFSSNGRKLRAISHSI